MILDTTTLGVLAIVSAAVLVQSTLGFGNALLAMPSLTLLIGIRDATPLVALLSTSVALGVVVKDRRDVRLGREWKLLLAALLGVPVGFFWLRHAPEAVVKLTLAVVIVSFALFQLLVRRPPRLRNDRHAPVFGLAAGTLGGAYNTFGPPIVIYGTLRGWTQQRFRANMQAFFLPIGATIISVHALGGSYHPRILGYYGLSLPLVLLAVILGKNLNRRIPADRFYTLVYCLLVLLGIALMHQVAMTVLSEIRG